MLRGNGNNRRKKTKAKNELGQFFQILAQIYENIEKTGDFTQNLHKIDAIGIRIFLKNLYGSIF